MDIQKEREEFEKLPAVAELIKTNNVWWSEVHGDYFGSDHELDCWIDGAWAVWQAKSQAVPEGFVLVPEDKISHFYQDNDEPENFCNSSNDWDCLGDGIEKDQIMIVNKHTQANISTEKFYGAWKLIETSYGTRWKFELFKSEFEAKQAMIEAQEQSHESD